MNTPNPRDLNDETLMDLLKEAIDERATPSESMVDMIMAGYDITNADSSLAQLTDDIRLDQMAGVRATATDTRLLTFDAGSDTGAGADRVTFEFELCADDSQIVGHVEPCDGGRIHLEQAAGSVTDTLDATGQFDLALPSTAPFRLRYEPASGQSTATEWILP